MVINKQPIEPSADVLEAMGVLRGKGRSGRNLAKAFKKIIEGKIKAPSLMIGIMAATLQVAPKEYLKPLLGFWADNAKRHLTA